MKGVESLPSEQPVHQTNPPHLYDPIGCGVCQRTGQPDVADDRNRQGDISPDEN